MSKSESSKDEDEEVTLKEERMKDWLITIRQTNTDRISDFVCQRRFVGMCLLLLFPFLTQVSIAMLLHGRQLAVKGEIDNGPSNGSPFLLP